MPGPLRPRRFYELRITGVDKSLDHLLHNTIYWAGTELEKNPTDTAYIIDGVVQRLSVRRDNAHLSFTQKVPAFLSRYGIGV